MVWDCGSHRERLYLSPTHPRILENGAPRQNPAAGALAIPHKTANYPGVSGELSGSELLHHSEMSGRKTS